MGKIELIIDFGSSKISIYKKDAGLVLKEAAVVLISNVDGEQKLVAAGNEAAKIIGAGGAKGLHIIEPIKEGIIVQEKACKLMIESFIKRIHNRRLFRPIISAIVLVSCGLVNIEKRNIEEVCNASGIGEVLIVETPLALHAATGKPYSFVVDIGAAKTEIAIVNETGIVAGCSINIAGNSINQAIIDYLCDKHKMRVSKQNIEIIKQSACSFLEKDLSAVEVEGRSIVDNQPREVKLRAMELRQVVSPVIDKIIEVIESVTMMIPESIAESVSVNGFYLSGGTALMPGIGNYLYEKLYFKCNILDNPIDAAVNGAQKFFYDKQLLSSLLNVPSIVK